MAAWPVTGALPFDRATASSAKYEAKAVPPPSAVALANFASRSKRKARPGFSAGSVNWAEEAGLASGSRIWAGRQCADARANPARQAIWRRAGLVTLCIQRKTMNPMLVHFSRGDWGCGFLPERSVVPLG